MKILVTGAAGFIGSHLCERLLGRGHQVVGVDNFDPFYDTARKRANVATLARHERFRLVEADVRELDRLASAASAGPIDVVVHLAARAGVRPSIEDPLLYSQVNVEGTTAMLEFARRHEVGGFVFGSSSSVYGNNEHVPFSETDAVDHPISPYAATKRAGELLCHTYHHLFGVSVACLRFFTVYGPRQRPDLAIHKFARLLMEGRPISLYGDGTTSRDYTYVDDIVDGVEAAIGDVHENRGRFEIVNLGGSSPVSLRRLVELLSGALGVTPEIEWLPAQPGDVDRTYADVAKAERLWGYQPRVPIEVGIARFVDWLRAGVIPAPAAE